MGAIALFGESYPTKCGQGDGWTVLAGAMCGTRVEHHGADRSRDDPGRVVDRPAPGSLRWIRFATWPRSALMVIGPVTEGAVRRGTGPGGQSSGAPAGRREGTRTSGCNSARAAATNAAAGAWAIGMSVCGAANVRRMTAADLRSLDATSAASCSEPAVVAADCRGRSQTSRMRSRPIPPPRTPGTVPTTWSNNLRWRSEAAVAVRRDRRRARERILTGNDASARRGPLRDRRIARVG